MSSKILYSVDEVLETNGGMLPMSKSGIYKLIREGRIPCKNIGKRVFILGNFIDSLMKPDTNEIHT